MPWSNTLPHLDEAPVQRASFPSTVSSTMKPKPDAMPEPVMPDPEQPESQHAQHRADQGDEVGRQARARRPARQVKGGLPPQIQRQRVGDALVGGVVCGALDRLGIIGIERQHERPLALPQRRVAQFGGLGANRARSRRWLCRSRLQQRPPRASSSSGTCAITGLPPSVSTLRGRLRISLSQAGSQP